MKSLNRNWKIYLVHHTHSDIGYTHTQQKVIDIQMSHLDNALKLIEENVYRKEHERFRWSPEVTWIFEEWLKTADKTKQEKFIRYVQEGYIGIDAFYVNLLTGLCRPREIEKNFDYMKKLEDMTNVKVDSAMITDIPGWNWGIVNSLSENGIKYLSLGTNHSDRIGHIIEQFGDKPFYWQSKDKNHKVLAWVHGKGYAWFHTGLKATRNLSRKLKPSRMSRYLSSLEKKNYPYDIIVIRYTIGQDNGPTDENLCGIVEEWNKNHPKMQLHISTTSQAFKAFEEKYGNDIPVLSGEISPYWEDGAMSTSSETSLARNAGEKLTLAEKVSEVFDVEIDKTKLELAWKNTLFFNEHTWGAYNSISRPEHDFAKGQWEWKRNYALNAALQSDEIYESLVSKLQVDGSVVIYNPHDWRIKRLVHIETTYNGVIDSQNNQIISQKLKNGELVFVVEIDAKSKRVYNLTDEYGDDFINSKLKLEIENGIKSIKYDGREFVDNKDYEMNEYLFAVGKWGSKVKRQSFEKSKSVQLENGGLIDKYEIISQGYLAKKIVTTVEVNYYNEEVTIKNCVSRIKSKRKEGVYFAFPFNMKKAQIRFDNYFNDCVLEEEQLAGSNKNFMTATRFVDISNKEVGVAVFLKDAPIFKTERIYHDPFRSGPAKLCGWKTEINEMSTVFSYVMNNYWMTNYKAYQEGDIEFSYVLKPHLKYEFENMKHFSIECAQPLLISM